MATLGDRIRAVASAAIDRLFVRSKLRAGLIKTPTGDKRLIVSAGPVTLPGLYELTAREHGVVARRSALEDVRKAASGYLDAQAAAAKAAAGRIAGQIASAAQAGLTPKLKKELTGALDHLLTKLSSSVERIVETEATAVRNLAGLEAISAMNVSAGVDDPIVFWVITRQNTCKECYRLHTVDGVRPKVWRLSEVSRSYHERGQNVPSIFGLHPHCRCSMTTLMPGWSFDADGYVKFKDLHHNEYEHQRR